MTAIGSPSSGKFVYVFEDQRYRIPSVFTNDVWDDYQGAYYSDVSGRLTDDLGFMFTDTHGHPSTWHVGRPGWGGTSAGEAFFSYVRDYYTGSTGVRWTVQRPNNGGWTASAFYRNVATGAIVYYSSYFDVGIADSAGVYQADYFNFPPAGYVLHALTLQDGILDGADPALSDMSDPSWQSTYVFGVTNPFFGQEFYLTSGPSTGAALAFWEPYGPMWRTPGHKWPGVFMDCVANIWGSDGGMYWRMAADRQSYWLADKVGVHFVHAGARDTVATWPSPLQSGDWIEITAVGSYLRVDSAQGGDVTLTQDRNSDCTIHGVLDVAGAVVRTNFAWLDINEADNYGNDLVVVEATVDTTGHIDLQPRYDMSPPNGQNQSRSAIVIQGPDQKALVVAEEEENSYAWYAHAWLHAFTVGEDGVAEASVLIDDPEGNVSSAYFYAQGMSHNEPWLIGDELDADGFGRCIWLAPKVAGAEPPLAFSRSLASSLRENSDIGFGRMQRSPDT